MSGETNGPRGPYKNYGGKPKKTTAEKKMAKAKAMKKWSKKKTATAQLRASQQKARGALLSKLSKTKGDSMNKKYQQLQAECERWK